jgi:hypothetical protein
MKIKSPGFRIGASYATAFSMDGEHLGVVGPRGVALWSVASRRRLRTLRLLRHPAAVAFAPDGQTFVVKNTLGELLLAETATVDPIARFAPPTQDEGANPVFAAPDLIIDGSWSGEIRARDTTRLMPRVLWRGKSRMVGQVMRAGDVWAFEVTAIHSHPEFESAAGADQVLVADAPDGARLRAVERTWRFLRGAALSPDGRLLSVRYGAERRIVEVLDVSTGRVVAFAGSDFGGTGWAHGWAPDGKVLVLVERRGFSFRDTSDLREIGWLPSEYPAHVSFSAERGLIALGDWSTGVVAPWPELLTEITARQPAGASASMTERIVTADEGAPAVDTE